MGNHSKNRVWLILPAGQPMRNAWYRMDAQICHTIGIVILAAGGSTRMGRQKLLLDLGGKSVIRRCVESALESKIGPVAVVVGSEGERVRAELEELPVMVVANAHWRQGQASSVACGIAALRGCDAAIVVVADQPFVSSRHLLNLKKHYLLEKDRIVISKAAGCRGNPALFPRSAFKELCELEGDQGARQLFGRLPVFEVEQDEPYLFLDLDDPDSYRSVQDAWYLRHFSRREFPLLHDSVSGKDLSYLDSAATTQVPSCVLRAQETYERTWRANIHRGLYGLAEKSSDLYEEARAQVASFFGVSSSQLIFTHGATESMNLAIQGWGRKNLSKDDLVLVDVCAHHAAIVPWQMLQQEMGIRVEFIDVDGFGTVDRASWLDLLGQDPKAVTLTHVSNVTGLECDIASLAEEAHRSGAAVFADCSQSAGHIPVRFSDLGVDFAAASAHKMYGPFGIGLLWVAPGRMREMRPVFGGGGMIEQVSRGGFKCAEGLVCFEAGTPNISGAVGFAEACRYLEGLGMDSLARFGRDLSDYAVAGLSHIEGVTVIGGTALQKRSSIVSFALDGVHPHDIAAVLSDQGVAVRAGHHCAMPLHQALGISASVRASFGTYSSTRDVDRMLEALEYIQGEYCYAC